jgi:beta-glucosidase
MPGLLNFPPGFVWGTATSAYQIEGGWNEDGRGPSIWDTFVHAPGKIIDGSHGEIAADSYHRWQEDIQIMKQLGISTYRFSISWSRVFPNGAPPMNHKGMDFYQRLVDSLLENGIQPIATLYHFDLPQALQDAGGWSTRDTALKFADYAHHVAVSLADRVSTWITINEPMIVASMGYISGEHAPGERDISTAIATLHHLLLSHGLAVDAIRSSSPNPQKVGIALNLTSAFPASDSPEDARAAYRLDTLMNRSTLDPVLLGQYPQEILDLVGMFLPPIEENDLKIISAPIDFLGVNYYTRAVAKSNPDVPFLEFEQVFPESSSYSPMWEIYPQGIYELLRKLWLDYHPKQILITENGIPVAEQMDVDGKIRDMRRIQYLQDHLVQVHRAISEGVPVKGYLVWSLLDNFEWALGYTMRFGLVHIDLNTQNRTIKESGQWFSRVIQQNGFSPQLYFSEQGA